MIFKKLGLVAILTSAFFLTACDNANTAKPSASEPTTTSAPTSEQPSTPESGSAVSEPKPAPEPAPAKITVGVIVGPEMEIAKVAQQQAKELYNLDVELKTFNDYMVPNQALNDGLIDVNAFQHKPYLDKQIEDKGYKLVVVGNSFVYPIAGYSKKLKPESNTTEVKGVQVTSPRGDTYIIPDNSTIAIPNDPSNQGRALLLLQHQGLITVEKSRGLLPRAIDITSNPHNYKIIELDPPMLPRSLDDAKVTLAIINNAFAGQVNLTSSKDGIFVEDKESPYVNIIVARENNKDDENVKNFVKAYQTEAVAKKASEVFEGGAIKGW